MVFCKRCDGDVETQVIEPSGIVYVTPAKFCCAWFTLSTRLSVKHEPCIFCRVCTECGHVLDQHSWSQEPTFTKEGGENTVAGHFVSNKAGSHGMGHIANGRIYGLQLDATEKAGGRAKAEIERIVDLLQIHPREDVVNSAQRLFMLALTHNFTKGRRTAQVAAATIYIICRQEDHPFMLLDFADVLQVNVFHLGSVFLQLCSILRLEDHPIVTKPVDPSLYIHRFADRLSFGSSMRLVADTALRLIRTMKQNWLQTGRRPSGLCGAALYIAGHMHGFPISKQDVIRVVHVGEATLDKRVSEFTTTDEALLTAAEFKDQSKRDEEEEALRIQALEPLAALPAPDGPVNHGCLHIRDEGAQLFCDGMCRECYIDYVRVVGGHDGKGHHPPAFKPTDTDKMLALEHEERMALPEFAGQGAVDGDEESGGSDAELGDEMDAALHEGALQSMAKAYVPAQALQEKSRKPKRKRQDTDEAPAKATRGGTRKSVGGEDTAVAGTTAVVPREEPVEQPVAAAKRRRGRPRKNASAEVQVQQAVLPADYIRTDDLEKPSETLSDLDDDDMDRYLNTPAETKLKDIVWTAMNQDYIEKQALKAAQQPKPEVTEDGTAGGEKGGKRPRGRPKGSKTKQRTEQEIAPATSAADGVRKMLDAKKLSSKINYANLDSLFAGDQPEDIPKPLSKPAAVKGRPKGKQGTGAGPAPDVVQQDLKESQAATPAKQRKSKTAPEAKTTSAKAPVVSKNDVDGSSVGGGKLRSSTLGKLKARGPAQKRTTLSPL